MRFDNKNPLGKHCFKYRQALSNARPSCPGQKEFSRADLVSWGLLVEMGASSSQQVNGHHHGNFLFMFVRITQLQCYTYIMFVAHLRCKLTCAENCGNSVRPTHTFHV